MSTTNSQLVTVACAGCGATGPSVAALAEACVDYAREIGWCPMRQAVRDAASRRRAFRQLREGDPISPYDGSPA